LKILLTGSNGFLGKYIYNTLSSEYSVLTLSRSYSDFNIDLSVEIPSFSYSFDCVIHSAGLAHINFKSIDQSKLFFQVNVLGTINLLKSLEVKSLPKYFVFISSVSVYGLSEGIGIDENYPLKASDPYGLSKIEAEKIILNWCAEKNIICTILRLPLIVGENPPGNLGAMINAIKSRKYFNVSNGRARRSMVLASDVASCIIRASTIGGIFNLTDGYNPTFLELSSQIGAKFSKKINFPIPYSFAKIIALIGDLFGKLIPFNTKSLSKVTSTLIFDDSKARELFNWNPTSVLTFFKK
jgi:nucleoside-diphosphate-sugar epimerase